MQMCVGAYRPQNSYEAGGTCAQEQWLPTNEIMLHTYSIYGRFTTCSLNGDVGAFEWYCSHYCRAVCCKLVIEQVICSGRCTGCVDFGRWWQGWLVLARLGIPIGIMARNDIL